MDTQASEIKQIATQLLAGMLANPHIYASTGDEEGRGQLEHALTITAIEIAEQLVHKVEQRHSSTS